MVYVVFWVWDFLGIKKGVFMNFFYKNGNFEKGIFLDKELR